MNKSPRSGVNQFQSQKKTQGKRKTKKQQSQKRKKARIIYKDVFSDEVVHETQRFPSYQEFKIKNVTYKITGKIYHKLENRYTIMVAPKTSVEV